MFKTLTAPLLGLALAGTLAAQGIPDWEKQVNGGPGKAEPDVFNPAATTPLNPKKGGRVIVHLSSLPKHINYMTENSAVTRRMLREVHEPLVQRNWEFWHEEPVLAEEWWIEDTVIKTGGRGEDNANVLYGKVTDDGDHWLVTPLSPHHALGEPMRVPKDEVESVERETVFTFKLHEGVKWHDGHVLDSDDLVFSMHQYWNPAVECDATRFTYTKFAHVEALDELHSRFFYEQQYFLAKSAFVDFQILPSHIYNLADPANPDHDAEATDEEQGTYINEHPANRAWIGLGPYQVTEWNNQYIEAKRFDGYFNPEEGGYVDTIRWRHISSDDTAKQALINGELDYWDRLRPEDYFGEYVEQPAFKESYYKGLASFQYMGYIVWNMRRPLLSDVNVRRALAHAFNWPEYIETVYYGLASQVTGTQYHFSPNNDRSIEPIPFDLTAAEDLLLDAGFYDRDGDGIVDSPEGEPFVIEFLTSAGNKASKILAEKIQESFAKIGVRVDVAYREWATFLERLDANDFDSASLAWITKLESDPEQIWHSKWADKPDTSNRAGYRDAETDRLIEAIQVELDRDKRTKMFHEMQRRIYEQQPYLFNVNLAKKLAISKRIRNFKSYAPDPGYRIREWYLEDAKGTREASSPKGAAAAEANSSN